MTESREFVLNRTDLGNGLYLCEDENGLSLVGGELLLRADFSAMLNRVVRGRINTEMIVKASKIKSGLNDDRLHVAVDATAGLGEDSFLLAAAGFEVILYEYNPVIAALLEDGIRRGMEDNNLRPIVSRMKLRKEDSVEALPKLGFTPDVIILDPMFPKRQKSALIKKKFQLLQKLEGPCSTEEELLNAAMLCRPKKIVIKRPLKGPYLNGVTPSHSIEGKAIRYDVVVNA